MAEQPNASSNHYQLLGVQPTASAQQIRRAYRDLSKFCHPDTTELPADVAKEQFQALNEAYATLSAPEKRLAYDYSIGYSRVAVMQAPAYLNRPAAERSRYESSSAYLDPTDRPLSAGELFALFILGVTFVCCLMMVVEIGLTKGDAVQAAPPSVEATEASLDTAPLSSVELTAPSVPSSGGESVLSTPEKKPDVGAIPTLEVTEPLRTPTLSVPVVSPP